MLHELVIDDCWNRIGVKGDGSCPELKQHVHCRNCPVYAGAGNSLFDREPPTACVQEWTRQIAQTEPFEPSDTVPVLVFRCGEEWLGLNVARVIEVGEPRVVHRIPHRSNKLLLGLVNIRGELQLCVALRELLGIDGPLEQASTASTNRNSSARTALMSSRSHIRKSPHASEMTQDDLANIPAPTTERLVVVERESHSWAFVVDDVAGVMRMPLSELGNVPATVANSLARYSRGVFHWSERSIGYLDDERLFEQLRRAIG